MLRTLTILFLLFFSNGYAQHTFEYTHHDQFTYCTGIEINDSSYAFLFLDSLLIFTDSGEITSRQKIFDRDSGYIYKFFRTSDTTFISTGYYNYEPKKKMSLWIRTYDNEFNTIDDRKYVIQIEGKKIWDIVSTVDFMGNPVIFTNLYSLDNPGVFNDTTYSFYISMEGDSVVQKQYDSFFLAPHSVLESPDMNSYFLIGMDRKDYLEPYIIKFDNALEIDSIYSLSSLNLDIIQSDYPNIKNYSPGKFLFSTLVGNYDKSIVGVFKSDYSLQNIQSSLTGNFNENNETAMIESIDYIDTTNIFVGGNVLDVGESDYFFLSCFDQDLNIKWEKFYSVDNDTSALSLRYVMATSDGGVILISNIYWYPYMYANILKLNANGSLTSVPENSTYKLRDMFLYPNPGNENLNIRTAVQSLGGIFNLYDISGKEVLNTKIIDKHTTIDTGHLPAGTYLYEYIIEGKTIETGKWMKK